MSELKKEAAAEVMAGATNKKGKIDRAQAKAVLADLVKRGMDPVEARAVVMARTDTYTIKGGSDVVWGVDDTSTLGIVINFNHADSGQFETVPNQQGGVTGVVIYDIEQKVSIDVIAAAAAVRPAIGTSLEIDGVAGIVLSSSVKKTNKSLQMFTIEVTGWTNFAPGS